MRHLATFGGEKIAVRPGLNPRDAAECSIAEVNLGQDELNVATCCENDRLSCTEQFRLESVVSRNGERITTMKSQTAVPEEAVKTARFNSCGASGKRQVPKNTIQQERQIVIHTDANQPITA